MKKTTIIEIKLIKELENVCKNTWLKNQSLNLRRFVLSNSNVGKIITFKNIFSDSLIDNPDH